MILGNAALIAFFVNSMIYSLYAEIASAQDKTLITGAHRLAAAKLLGWMEIEATVSGLDGLRAELAEIDENLMRNELHYIDRGQAFKRRESSAALG